MQTAIAILAHTPPWVFALLALLIWQGCTALQPRSQPLARMLIIPAVFFLMGLSRLVLGGKSIGLVLVWMAAAAVFAAVALYTGPRSVTVDGATGRILRPGSVVPLVRNLTVFGLQYTVAVVTAMKLQAAWEVAVAGQAVSGACAGYFWAGPSRCCAVIGRVSQRLPCLSCLCADGRGLLRPGATVVNPALNRRTFRTELHS